ncbi:MAG: M13-type metalloendopeptidase [Treponema sp.]|jgi:uncharacterized repeat protein (TIGR02543 family)|nr:M13-type metalloendopeptidase [Treponema sp.]
MRHFKVSFVGSIVLLVAAFYFTACQQVTEKYYITSYTVAFDANGGTGKMKSQTFEKGKAQAISKNSFVAPDGKVFAGWGLDSDDRQISYTYTQVINIEENCTLYAKWKMIEGSGSATETKEFEFVFDEWQTSDKSIKPGDDFYNFAAGRLFDGTNENLKSVLVEQEENLAEFYEDEAKNPSFKLGEIAKTLKDTLTETDIEQALAAEIMGIDSISSLEELYKKIAENIFVQNSAFVLGPVYFGREFSISINVGVEEIESEENPALYDLDKVKAFFDALEKENPDSDWQKETSVAYPFFNDFLKDDIGMDLPELDIIKILDRIAVSETDDETEEENGTEAVDFSLENAKKFLKYCAVQNSNTYKAGLEDIFKTQPFYYPVLKVYKEKIDSNGEAKKSALEMCEEFRGTFKSRIKNNTWMSETSKKNAIKKADEMYFLAGYPNEIPAELIFEDENAEDYSDFITFYKEISKKSVCEYIKRLCSNEFSEKQKVFDFIIFIDTPVTANAFYFPEVNAVNICAPNLNSPFFDTNYADAYNYTVLGASTIGHEMCHAFDNLGSQYDEKGKKSDWWTVSDKLRYKQKQQEMTTLFNQYMMESGYVVNGEKTLGENMADYGGLVVAYETFLNKKSTELTTESLTKQRKVFFQSYVLAWANSEMDEESLTEDPHAPFEFRVKGPVSNIDDWYELYDVQYGDKYYLLPEQRIILW